MEQLDSLTFLKTFQSQYAAIFERVGRQLRRQDAAHVDPQVLMVEVGRRLSYVHAKTAPALDLSRLDEHIWQSVQTLLASGSSDAKTEDDACLPEVLRRQVLLKLLFSMNWENYTRMAHRLLQQTQNLQEKPVAGDLVADLLRNWLVRDWGVKAKAEGQAKPFDIGTFQHSLIYTALNRLIIERTKKNQRSLSMASWTMPRRLSTKNRATCWQPQQSRLMLFWI